MAKDNIDERVVQLMLDSKEFDSNAKKSIQSLDDLKKALEFEGASKGFDAIERAARKVDFSIMDNGIQKVQDHFNLLNTVATTVIERITNSAIDSGTRMVKALSVDQISQGWSQYEDRTIAVQRIMSATSSQFSNQEEQMAAVNEQLEKLIWFTDETSYKYLDMVNNIGKFTANNIDLGKSVKAMEGISTWASLSGASIEEAGRAMYNLSQAMSVGAVKLQDWKSIENANMATFEFKQTAIETAVAMGTLKKGVGDVYDAFGKAYTSAELFSDGLKQGWFTSEVLLETLGKYGGFADELNAFVDETGVLTTTAIRFVDDYVDGTLDMEQAMQATRLSAEELTEWMEILGSEENELGRRAFKASQETKTLSEAIDYIKTAVSSGWAQSFQYIFGDYTEAKEWWSEVSEALYEVFVISGETRNSLLEMWKELGGRDTFLKALRTLAKNIKGVLDSISGAWDAIFGKGDLEEQARRLIEFTDRFKAFAESITFTDSTFQDFLRILESIFRILKTIGRTIATVLRALEPVGRALNKISGILLNMVANLLEFASFKFENFFNDQKLQSLYNTLNLISKVLTVLVIKGLEGLFDLLEKVGAGAVALYNIFEQYTGGIDVIFLKLTLAVLEFWDAFMAGETFANKVLDVIISVFQGGIGAIILLVKSIYDAFTGHESVEAILDNYGIMDWIDNVKEALGDLDLEGKLAKIIEAFSLVARYIREFFMDLQNVDSELRQTLGVFGDELKEWYGWFKKIIMEMSAEDIAKVGMLVAMTQLILGMNNLTKASKNFVSAGSGILNTVNLILQQFKNGEVESLMSRITGLFAKTKILQIGIGVTMLVAAFNQLNKMDHETTTRSLVLLSSAFGVFLIIFKKWDELSTLAAKHRAENQTGGDVGLLVLEIGAAFLAMSLAISNVSEVFSGIESAEQAMNKVLPAIFGLTAMGAALVAMMAVLKKIDAKDMTQTAGAMILIATSITMLSVPLAVLSKMDFLTMMGGLIGVAGLLVSVGAAMYLMKGVNWKTMLTSAVAFTALAGAITLLAVPILALGKMGEGYGAGLGATVSLIMGLASAIGIFTSQVDPKNIMSLSVAFISFSAAISMLAIAALMLQSADLTNLAITMTGMVVVLGVLVGVLMAYQPASLILEQLSKSLLNAGLAMLSAAAGALLLTIAFEAFQMGIVGLGLVATAFGDEFPEILKKGLEATRIIMDGLVDIFLDLAPKIAMAIGTIILAIKAAKWYNQIDSEVVKKIIKIGILVISAIGTLGGPIIDAITKLIQGLNDGLPDFLLALRELAFNILQGIGLILRDMIGGICYMIRALFTGEMVSYDTYLAFEGGMETALNYSAMGVRQGADGLMHAVEDVYGEAGKAAPGFFNDGQGASSPAKEFIEALLYSAMGVEKGGNDFLIPQAQMTGETAGQAIVDGFAGTAIPGISNATSYISKILGEYEGYFGGSSKGLFNWSSSKKGGKDIYAGLSDYERGVAMAEHWTEEEVKQLLASRESKKKETEEKAYDVGFDFGSSIGDSFGKGTSSGAKASTKEKIAEETVKEKEKTAEEIVDEYISAIEKAYSRGIEQLDLSTSHLNLQDKMWNLTHKEGTTDAEKLAYEAAKKEHELDMLDKQMESQLWKISLKQAEYEDKLNTLGSSAVETQKAYNELLEEQYNILDLYSQKQELMSEESESTAEDFIAASKEISSYRKLVEEGVITEQMMIDAANEKLRSFRKEESDLAKTHTTELDNALSQVITSFEENGGDLKKAFGTIVTEAMIESFDNVGDNAEGLAGSLTETMANMITIAKEDPKLIEETKGVGADIVNGAIDGMDKTKDKFIKNAKVISHDGLDAMADVFDINSPSKETYKMGVWLDEGLANGLLNDGAVTKVLNAADEIARKLLARLKETLGVSSPSKETYAIGKWLDAGMANGVSDYASMIMKSSDKMVSNLVSNMKSQIDQNGSEMKAYLKDSFGLTDDDLRFTVIVDADTSLADSSLTELERAYAYWAMALDDQTSIPQQSFSTVNGGNSLLAKLNEAEAYRATQLQDLYDLINSYVTEQKSKNFSGENSGDAGSATIVNNFNQTNISPKPISALDTYRNTQKQFNTFSNKFSKR